MSLVGNRHFATAGRVLLDMLPQIETMALPRHSILSINVPDVPYEQIQGIEVTRLGHRHLADSPVKTVNPRGKECYWIAAAGDVADDGPGTDFNAIANNRVSITPIQMDMTLHNAIAPMAEYWP